MFSPANKNISAKPVNGSSKSPVLTLPEGSEPSFSANALLDLPPDLINPLTVRIPPAKGRAAQEKLTQLIYGVEFFAPLLANSAGCFSSPVQQVAWLQQTLTSVNNLLTGLPAPFQKQAQLKNNPWVGPALAKILITTAFGTFRKLSAPPLSSSSTAELDKSFSQAFLTLATLLDDADFFDDLINASLLLTANPVGSVANGSIDSGSIDGESSSLASPLAQVKLAWFSFLVKVGTVQHQYSFFRPDPEADLLSVSRQAWAALLEVYQPLVPHYAFIPDRVAFLVSLIDQLGEVFVGCWIQEGVAAEKALAGKSKTTIGAWQRKNPQGFPLTTVWQKFSHQVRSITLLAKLTSNLGGSPSVKSK